uniref:Uncharacterized protein n=1 Tax=Sinocyclocheilus grahami TaxID=75366 RepID=A0A672QQ20_SINGR
HIMGEPVTNKKVISHLKKQLKPAPVRDLVFTPNGSLTLVSASRDKTLRIWDLAKKGASPHVLRGPDYWVFRCSISPDCSVIASVSVCLH